MAPVIVAKDLYKCYPGFAPVLRGANIEVQAGEVAAIMGPSGCGKSTMLHILGMLHAPDSGSLEILGTNVLTLTREQTAAFRRDNMGFVMQASNLFDHSTVFENVEFPLIYENVPPQERWERVIHALDLVKLSARVHYRSNRLSGGEQQRVAIARAMVNNPRILLADEPTGALDARTSRLVMENFLNLCHNGGVSMIMVTHDPKMAEYCDSVYTLEEGILHCKKKGKPPFCKQENVNFFKQEAPLVRGVLVTGKFPNPANPWTSALARRMNVNGLLARIYSTERGSFLGNPEGYSLPLPVRHPGFGYWLTTNILSIFGLIKSCIYSRNGNIVAQWIKQDEIQFLCAAGDGDSTRAVCQAFKATQVPFAFAINGKTLLQPAETVADAARSASFVACPTEALMQAFMAKFTDIDKNRLMLIRYPLPQTALEDEESQAPAQPGKPVEILVGSASAGFLKFVIDACGSLKNVDFRISIAGCKTWKLSHAIHRAGLKDKTAFVGLPQLDNLAEIYRNADIFVAAIPEKDEELELPYDICLAMASGVAIISCGLTQGQAEALIPDQNCLVSPPGNMQEFAARLEKLIRDGKIRSRLGENSRRDIRALLEDSGSRQAQDIMVEAAGLAERRENLQNGL